MAVQDLNHWNNEDLFYLEYFRNIATLSPKFEYPYLFGIYVAPNEKSPALLDEMASISSIGMSSLPLDWSIPFYLSTKYKTLTKNDARALYYLSIANKTKGAPEVVHLVYSSFIKNEAKDRGAVRQMIKVIYDTTDNETIKNLAAKGIFINDLNEQLEKAIAKFKIKYGIFPGSTSELEKVNLLYLSPEIKNSYEVEINKDGKFKLKEKPSQN
jgi:hypothetical protein